MTGSRPEPVFPGLRELLEVIRGLCDRPGFFYRSKTEEVVGDQPLPLLYLESEASPTPFLRALEAKLDEGVPQIPHAYVDATTASAEVAKRWPSEVRETQPLLPLLDELRHQLAAVSVGGERLTRFDHYRLVDWLTGQRLPRKSGRDERANVIGLMRRWTGRTDENGDAVNRAVDAFVPNLVTRLGLGLVAWVGGKIGFRWLGKRVPGLSREAKWFMRKQNFALPNHSIEFLGFAERLTLGRREWENTEQIKLLLVHAFLEDLRIAYRRRRWRFVPRRAGWRRTAYMPVLLDGVSRDNGGWELLELINVVRNETGELDPLLVIAASAAQPKLSAQLGATPVSPEEAAEALATWREELPRKRQMLAPDARYLLIELPFPHTAKRQRWTGVPVFQAAPVHWLARSRRLEALIAAAAVVLLVPGFMTVQSHWSANCAFVGSAVSSGVSTRLVDIDGNAECVGYSDNSAQVFGSNERLRWTQLAVYAQNEEAERLHAADPARPYVTLLYFSSLTHPDTNPDADHSRAEELEGMLLKQRQQNDKSQSEPLLRIVVANGGSAMKRAPEVLRDMLTPLLENDPGIMGVVGLDRSVQETKEVITELGVLGVPTIGTTLTEASLPNRSALYFQLIPGNLRQAQLVTKYAQHVRATKVTIYHPPLNRGDIYLTDLVGELAEELPKVVPHQDFPWNASAQELPSLCTEDHGSELVFYAGREEGFGDFLRAIGKDCYDKNRLPRIVADDAVMRFVAQKVNRVHDSLAGMRVAYVSMAGLVVLAGKSCLDGAPDPKVRGGRPLDVFCAGYSKLHQEIQQAAIPDEDKPSKPWPGEHMGVSYDATGLFLEAVRETQRRLDGLPGRMPQRGAVGQEFRELKFNGATGRTDFGTSRVGERRNLSILEIANIHDYDQQPTCVFLTGDLYDENSPRQPNGCPVVG
ncbi:hypothetical protein Lesp02_21490 [Lentzea sp. NBRC 105346]|uniref:hypothetical protein n=1 Tax=Lentzea sp. NBRC 105346 TaxID=3032205 RepID=UPI0024A09281|nr:hypothetical protein [Lentzea sp. NBRC 105346]GLZ29959.1 hypothetical protein Lesp02_21490 [Lentzea sp. NBRC 105346]